MSRVLGPQEPPTADQQDDQRTVGPHALRGSSLRQARLRLHRVKISTLVLGSKKHDCQGLIRWKG